MVLCYYKASFVQNDEGEKDQTQPIGWGVSREGLIFCKVTLLIITSVIIILITIIIFIIILITIIIFIIILIIIEWDDFRDGVIFFPEFCKVILRKFREDNVEVFGPYMFKVGNSFI